ncbi:aspartate-semialdehyde dehydrogenase [Ignisphaera sp. 4213-co]|uniref:Aspartate-semialdehyde dehydrogenase n=1 Tax=Ignisphaera cupida TaxID=3050454 RepID=A0ABD4Z7F1_9CREN|nr:aspartate-semialdehyde dehydrogenase [Ignisphaera sp. 4213-co]MDK6029135.1 aspartate-semialdehyde dehydrogenase [Ignisphaera sp. 4213-co]
MKRRVAVLGATGIVGQRFVQLLADHPWFELELLMASERSAGRKYVEAVHWVLEKPMPKKVYDMQLYPIDLNMLGKERIDIVFTALPSDAAKELEPQIAKKGIVVVSNASSMRLEPDIPLLNPEVNADHVEIIEVQRRVRGWSGAIAKVPNCTTAIVSLTLKPLLDEFGIGKVVVSTMQALSGAGLTGVPSMFILDNLIPYIEGEEDKVETESRKILGFVKGNAIEFNNSVDVTASCHRVMVLEGHTAAVFVELKKKVSIDEVAKAMEEFRGNKIRGLDLPTAPPKPIVVRKEVDRPQPRLDRMEGNGMSVVVGRIREDRVLNGVKYVVLGHNTIRGAAGNGVLIAELLVKKGYA